jgi:hypothetical protein
MDTLKTKDGQALYSQAHTKPRFFRLKCLFYYWWKDWLFPLKPSESSLCTAEELFEVCPNCKDPLNSPVFKYCTCKQSFSDNNRIGGLAVENISNKENK